MDSSQQWQRALELFDELFELSEELRTAKIEKLEADDPELAKRVTEMFASMNQEDLLLDKVSGALKDLLRVVAQRPDAIGPYQVLDLLGEGGLGFVYLAIEAKDGVERPVAVKVLHPEKTGCFLGLMRGELFALKEMNHPHIAALYNWSLEGSQPYLVMEFVKGKPFDQHNEHYQLPLKARLKLFRQLCEAVEHSHSHMVVHGDLKPRNILVTRSGETDNVKVIDFGIARLQASDSEAWQSIPLMGTMCFMSPESLVSKAAPDLRQDIYALGILLCQLLCGDYPYQPDPKTDTLDEVRRKKAQLEVSPYRIFRQMAPDERVKVSKTRGFFSSRALESQLKGELDSIVHKAAHPDPEQRYRNMSQLLEDLDRYEKNQPLEAMRPHKWGYLLLKRFIRRPVPVLLAFGSVLFAIGFVFSYIQIRNEKGKVEKSLADLKRTHAFYLSMLNSPHPYYKGSEVRLMDVIQLKENELHTFADGDDLLEAQLWFNFGAIHYALGNFEAAEQQINKAIELRGKYPCEGENALETTVYMDQLARLYGDQGKIEASTDLYKRIFAILRPFGPHTVESLNAQAGYGRILYLKGAYQDAEALLQSAQRQLIELLGMDHRMVWTASTNLALAMKRLGENEKALALMTTVLESKEKTLGVDHPFVVDTRFNLECILIELRKFNEAAALYEHLEVQITTNEDLNQKANLLSLAGLGIAKFHLGQQAEAKDLLQRFWSQVEGKRLPAGLTVTAGSSLSVIYLNEDRAEEAYQVNHVIESKFPSYLEANREALLKFQNNHGEILRRLRRFAEAEVVLKEALQAKTQLFGETDRTTLNGMLSLGELAMDQQKYEAALQYFESVVGLSAQQPKNYQDFCKGYLGQALVSLKRYSEAVPLLEAGIEVEPAHSPRMADLRKDLAKAKK